MTFHTGFGENIVINPGNDNDMPEDIYALTAAIMAGTSHISKIFDSRPPQYIYLVLLTYLAAYQKTTGDNLARLIAASLEVSSEFPLEPMEEYPEC